MECARTILGLPFQKCSAGVPLMTNGCWGFYINGNVEVHQRYKDLRSEGFELINQVSAMERAFVSRRFSLRLVVQEPM